MGLDMMHDREFYLAKAEEHELLEKVVAGETTFRKTLEAFLSEIDEKSPFALEPSKEVYHALENYITVLGVLYGKGTSFESPCGSIKNGWVKGFLGTMLTGEGLFYLVLGVIAPIVPPLALAALATGYIGVFPLSLAAGKNSEKRQVAKQREKLLKPIIEAADALDAEIGYVFVLDHFTNARQRFEQRYPKLSDGQRQSVDSQLHSYLVAGGIPGMDERQLRGYLSGLLDRGRDDNA